MSVRADRGGPDDLDALSAGHVHARRCAARGARRPGAGGVGGGIQSRLGRAGRPVLPARRQRRLRRRALLAGLLGYDPATRQFDGTATITRHGDAEPVPLRPRSARVRHRSADRQRPAASFSPGRPGVGDHAAQRDCRSARSSPSWSATPACPSVITDPDGSIEGGCRPTTARSWSASRRGPRRGIRPTTIRGTRRRTTSGTVPDGITVMANGVLGSRTTAGGRTTWVWRASLPMAPYLATATLGRFDLTQSTAPGGIPAYMAVDPTLSTGNVLRKLPDIVDFYSLDLRAVPVRGGRCNRRRRPRGRLLAGDTDQAGLRSDARRGDAGPRDLAHVVRRLGDADRRGRTSGCTRASPPGRSGSGASTTAGSRRTITSRRSTTPRPRTPPSGRRRQATRAALSSCSTERSTTGAG